MTPVIWFTLLQVFDLLSTVFLLRHGASEMNRLMRALLGLGGSPALVLAVPKLAAIGLAVCAWRSGRTRLLRRVNVVFAACVIWNLLGIAAR